MDLISKCKQFVPNKIYCDACDENGFNEISSITVAGPIYGKGVSII